MSRILYAAGFVVGLLTSVVTVFMWINISPEEVGNAVYDSTYIAFPFIASVGGFAVGWCAKSWLYENNKIHSHDWFMAEEFPKMDFHAKERLCYIYENGSVDLDGSTSLYLNKLGIRDYVQFETIGPNEYRWRLVPWVSKELGRHKGVFDCVRKHRSAIDSNMSYKSTT